MKKVLIALLVMIGLVSCNGGKTFKITVNLENSTGKTVTLQKYDGSTLMTLQNAVAKNNTVVFKVETNVVSDGMQIIMDGWRRPVVFFPDNQDITITGDYQKAGGIKATGSVMQASLNSFDEEFNKLQDEEEMKLYAIMYVKENIENATGAYVMYRYKWAFSERDMKDLCNAMPIDMKCGYKSLIADYLQNLSRVSAGQPYTNIIQNDVNGNPMELASVIGTAKVVIVDFWASWCPDCRKENPELVKIYNEYKDKGVTVFSVSLDTDPAAWKKAIADDNLAWPHHVSDLQGWKNKAAGDYCISFIPQNVILDKNGVIVKRNVSINDLREAIVSVIN